MACAAGLATLGVYQSEGLLMRAKSLAKYWEDAPMRCAVIIALSPPLVIEQSQIDQIFGTLTAVLRGQ